ncbi:MAG TPA: Gfo/Idh/MocA family oxidoreductase, partial [Cyclobacteriaceae bacterium]|nr:Gfo/Idh/MocA family oxidoreductase [Cyclobacteriaceae bacterium]
LDDDAAAFLKFDNDATGILVATQVASGQENNLCIKVYGDKGGLEWRQEEPNTLIVRSLDKPKEVYRAGMGYLSDAAKKAARVPSGHPEGYLEAFANVYMAFANAVRDYRPGKKINAAKYDFPDVEDGVRGMAFVEAMVKSSKSNQKWTTIKN